MGDEAQRIVYKCRHCLRTSATPGHCHGEAMLQCNCGAPGDDCSRPVHGPQGRILTHAPRWWVEQTKVALRDRRAP